MRTLHVWRARIPQPQQRMNTLYALLSGDERARALRFVFERDRQRFIAARGMLREVLSHYCGKQPDRIEFSANSHGKPVLAFETPIQFNVSHSGDVALYGVANGRRVGVDVELMRTDVEFLQLAERFFSVRERAALEELGEPELGPAFFACWTRKEAYIKALGHGLSVPLERFSVGFPPTVSPRLIEDADDREASSRWTMHDLDAGPGYRAAAVVENPAEGLLFRDWPDSSSDDLRPDRSEMR